MTNTDQNNENLPENLQLALKEIVRQKELEDDAIRKQQIRQWKKADRFWHGIQFIYWSETQEDWISPVSVGTNGLETGNDDDSDGAFYDYVVNIYRAHGESIIAALSAQVPAVRFPPDDADNEDDRQTAKVYNQVADLVSRHNQSKMIILQALLALWNQGTVFAYHSPKADKAFGNIQLPNYKTGMHCESCGYLSGQDSENSGDPNTPTGTVKSSPNAAAETQGESDSSELSQSTDCPQCGQAMSETPILTGFTDSPKTRVIIDIYNPLFVKVPYYARTQEECGYLGLSIDQPVPLLKSLFDHITDEIDAEGNSSDQYEKMGRAPSSYPAIDRKNMRTLKRWWLRPYEFNVLGKEKDLEIKGLNKLFPDGCYVCLVGDVYAEARNENLDKYWTIGKAGISTFIHSDAMGQPLIAQQEKLNVLDNLTLETIEQGISTVFADPDTLDFEDYKKHELRPGMYAPARAKVGQNLGASFYEGPKATLSREVPLYREQLDHDAQFLVGSFPSIYGGPGEGSSRTAAEYDMSRQMALQRLSITWTMFAHWWARLMDKCVRIYVENVIADEHYVAKNKGNYVNVWIRQSELSGKVGEVEAEAAETFPVTLGQKQSLLFKLIGLNNDLINAALFDVENRKIIADVLAFPELNIPDEAQRTKQMREIQMMIDKKIPVEIEPEIDENPIHIDVLKDFMAGDKGYDLKVTEPDVYNLLMAHLMAHQQAEMMQQVQQLAPQPVSATSVAKNDGTPPKPMGVQ